MSDKKDCCEGEECMGDPRGLHSLDCPVYLASMARLEARTQPRRVEPQPDTMSTSERLALTEQRLAETERERDEAVRRCADLEQVREELAQSRMLVDGYMEDVPELTGRNAELVDRSRALKAELAKTERERDEAEQHGIKLMRERDDARAEARDQQRRRLEVAAELASARQEIEQLRGGGQQR